MAEALIKRKVWIDLAHSSDKSQKDLEPLLDKAHQPRLYTHTVLRKYLKAERGITQTQLIHVARTGGFIGLMPSAEMLEPIGSGDCEKGLQALAIHFKEAGSVVGENRVTFGTDFNGGITHLPPTCSTHTQLDQQGFWNMQQVPELWTALQLVGAIKKSSKENRVQTFLSSWATLWNGS